MMLGPSQIGSPFSKLLVVDWIIDFWGCKLPRVKGDGMQGAIIMGLRQDHTDVKVEGIGCNLESAGGVRVN